MRRVLAIAVAAALLAGCRADPQRWAGNVKFLEVHAAAFTPDSRGLLLVCPRPGVDDAANATAYYYYDATSMSGWRLGYGEYSLGAVLVCPFAAQAAVPVYMQTSPGQPAGRAYQVFDLAGGQTLGLFSYDDDVAFPPNADGPREPADVPATQPAAPLDPAELWQRVARRPLTAAERATVADQRIAWLTRNAPGNADRRVENVDGQAFYVLDAPDGEQRLLIRFHPPSDKPAKAAEPDGDGYAYAFLADRRTGRRFWLCTTNQTDQFFDTVGSAVVAGPVWLGKQIARPFRGR